MPHFDEILMTAAFVYVRHQHDELCACAAIVWERS